MILQKDPQHSIAFCNLQIALRTLCDWSGWYNESQKLKEILQEQISKDKLPCVSPFHSIMFPIDDEVLTLKKIRYNTESLSRGKFAKKNREINLNMNNNYNL